MTFQPVKKELYSNIKEILKIARGRAAWTINTAMVEAYWNIGRLIFEEEQEGKDRAGYGTYLIKNLSKKLTKDFGKGFSPQSLWNMRLFYITFPILSTVWRELTWSHYKLLIRIERKEIREYYARETIAQNWSVRALDRQINSLYYERIIASRNKEIVKKEAGKKTKELKIKPEDIIKDPYVLEFLDIKPDISYLEKELEQGLIDKLQEFLLELGKGFSFVARQKRIRSESSDYYIDLVFYNYILKCFILIDLKTGKLTHQDIGQMDMYVRYFEDKIKTEGDYPTIGMILCTEKDATVVKYSVLNENRQLFASRYKLYLPTEKELKEEIEKERKIIEMEKEFSSVIDKNKK